MGASRTLTASLELASTRDRTTATRLSRGRARSFPEWRALRRWGKLPPWETQVAGYLLRQGREDAGLTQRELGRRLGISQQAVAQAERWHSNPTVDFIRRWAAACGATLRIRIDAAQGAPSPAVVDPAGARTAGRRPAATKAGVA